MSPLPRPSTTSELQSELSDRQVQQAVRAQELTRVRRGYYVATSAWRALSPDNQAVMLATTAAARLGPAAVLSHTSAALLHGLPVGRLQVLRPHATWPSSAGRGATTSVIPPVRGWTRPPTSSGWTECWSRPSRARSSTSPDRPNRA